MSSQPIDEDGFHSIAWDDVPARPTLDITSPLDEENDGFETISPVSATTPEPQAKASSSGPSHARKGSINTEIDPAEWKGKWMNIEVRDPVKEHEGSKDQYVSYAVRTQVSFSLDRSD